MAKKSISRRDFLKGAAASTLGLAAVGMLGGCSSEDSPKASASTISWTKETDVLIVGAGGTGVCAAAAAAEAGAKAVSYTHLKIIIGKASIKVPFFERMDRLSLKLIPIDVKTSTAVPTADYINILVDAAVNIKISSDSERSVSYTHLGRSTRSSRTAYFPTPARQCAATG